MRRLAVGGSAWAVVVAAALVVVAAFAAPRPFEPTPEWVRVERGRLPSDPPRTVPSAPDARLSYALYRLAGIGAVAHCRSPADWTRDTAALARRTGRKRLGAWRAYASGYAANFSPEICGTLARLLDDPRPLSSRTEADAAAWSLAALAHEAQHVAGTRSEARAECHGMQAIPLAAELLGRTPEEGRLFATVYFEHWYVWHGRPYRSPECRNGGRLDLHPWTDVWP